MYIYNILFLMYLNFSNVLCVSSWMVREFWLWNISSCYKICTQSILMPSQAKHTKNTTTILCYVSIGIGVLVKVNIQKEIVYYTIMYFFTDLSGPHWGYLRIKTVKKEQKIITYSIQSKPENVALKPILTDYTTVNDCNCIN